MSTNDSGHQRPLSRDNTQHSAENPQGRSGRTLTKISRRTEKKGIPKYNGGDIFLYDGEELVPSGTAQSGKYQIHIYQPRTEESFDRIEHWIGGDNKTFYWKIITRDNTTHIFGRSSDARIADPDDPTKVFEWLIEQSSDDKGDIIRYQYKGEDDGDVSGNLFEKNRSLSNKYIKSVLYGVLPHTDKSGIPRNKETFAFELVFDYGEHDISKLQNGGTNPYSLASTWGYRPDAFSSYRSGFEVRTRRRCLNILMFHHFAKELGAPCLVNALSLTYDTKNAAKFSLLRSVLSTGYRRNGKKTTDPYEQKSMPALEFGFSQFQPSDDPQFQLLTLEDDQARPRDVPSVHVQHFDMAGEGLSGLLVNDHHGAWYMAPEGNGRYSEPCILGAIPSDMERREAEVSIADLEGNGQLELVVNNRETAGFYPYEGDGKWGDYAPFSSNPNNLAVAYMEAADLGADGTTDRLIAAENNILVYESKGRMGYAPATTRPTPKDFPIKKEGDKQELVTFCDVFGDGLSHRVKIRNGIVECWPDLGYGRFGDKVALVNAPNFGPDFDASRLHLSDVDGSGTTDLIYVFPNKVALFLNSNGNGFAPPVFVDLPETCSNIDQIGFADVLGNGTTCLTFTKLGVRTRHYFYNFVGETRFDGQDQAVMKPYLLCGTDNNMGARTQIQYASSTKFYLADKKAGRRWVTKLHFPVQVIEKTTTIDEISGARFVQRFAYHDGFYDREEKEFRGFGFVESWDTETYAQGQAIDKDLYVPPVYTKSWYHTGACRDGEDISSAYKDMYYKGDKKAYECPESLIPADSIPEIRRQSYIALKGHVLRQEVYGQDGAADAEHPYSVSESNFEVRLLRTSTVQSPYAVFMVLPRETIAYHYERNPADPRVQQSFILKTDDYGHVTRACEVVLPRRAQTAGTVHREQQKLHATLHTSLFAHETKNYRFIGAEYESQSFEVCGLSSPQQGTYFSFETIRDAADKALSAVISHDAPPANDKLQARRLSWGRHYFWNVGQKDALPLGVLPRQAPALSHHQEEAEFTRGFIDTAFEGRLNNETVTVLGGYTFCRNTGHYWNRSLVHNYKDGTGFFLPCMTENTFFDPTSNLYSKTTFTYDRFFLHPVKTNTFVDQETSHTITASIDYITGTPQQITDINGNVSQVLFDPLGHVIASSLFTPQEKASPAAGGMVLFGGDGQQSAYALPDAPKDPQEVLANPSKYLQGAAHYFFYDLNRWKAKRQPVCAVDLVRDQDYYPPDGQKDTGCKTMVSYSDGLGRILETKIKADPDPAFPDAERWQVSGRTVYNNKGHPCEQYLPYFSGTADYVDQSEFKTPIPPSILQYDPLGRVVKTVDPKKLFSKVEFTPWEEKHYDENDTVKDSEYYRDFHQNYPSAPSQAQRDEKDALNKAAAFHDTPTTKVLDTLGRSFLSIETQWDGGKRTEFATHTAHDILGRVVKITDPRLYSSNQTNGTEYYNFKYVYAMGDQHPILTDSVDAGVERHFYDIYRDLIWSLSPRDYCQLITYDRLRRRTKVNVKKISAKGSTATDSDGDLVEEYVYGESQSNPQNKNLNGRLCELKDLSGVEKTLAYDLRGNPLGTSRQLLQAYKAQANWAADTPPALEETVHTASFTHNAIGHVLSETAPDGSVTNNGYNQIGLLKSVSVRFSDGTSQAFVKNIEYDALDQRMQVAYGNGVVTTYAYEPTTQRLERILSTRPNGPGKILQDLNYTYDPAGNVTRIRDNAVKTIFNGNQGIKPLSDYTYDALYRLIKATGRQHPGVTANMHASASAADFKQSRFSQLPSANDNQALEVYTEIYTYDASGNLIQKQHRAQSGRWSRKTPVEAKSNRLKDYGYDASGNMQSLDSHGSVPLHFNYCENLVSAGVIERQGKPFNDQDFYVYDSGLQRSRKVSERLGSSGATTHIDEKIYLGNYEIKREHSVSSSGKETTTFERQSLRVMDGVGCVATVHNVTTGKETGRTVRFQLANQQESFSLELDESALLISYEEYFPYGGTAIIAGRNKVEVNLKEYRYSGKERDDATGFYYYGARYYPPWLGRWLKPDPAGTVDGPNLYAFVGGNPVTHVDVGGMAAKTKKGAKAAVAKKAAAAKKQYIPPVGTLIEFSKKLTHDFGRPTAKKGKYELKDNFSSEEIHTFGTSLNKKFKGNDDLQRKKVKGNDKKGIVPQKNNNLPRTSWNGLLKKQFVRLKAAVKNKMKPTKFSISGVEILHMLAHSQGGTETMGNASPGSVHANTEDIAFETAVRTHLTRNVHEVTVKHTHYVKKDGVLLAARHKMYLNGKKVIDWVVAGMRGEIGREEFEEIRDKLVNAHINPATNIAIETLTTQLSTP